LKITILGCGTSFGVPMIACTCKVCSSFDPRNTRTRASILITHHGKNILVDTATDLRAQAIANVIDHIDAVLYTHPHAEHIHGVDELRRFNWLQGTSIPCYGSPATMERIERVFDYIFVNPGLPGWQPNLTSHPVTGPFAVYGLEITPFELMHGEMPIYGYKAGGFAYLTDFLKIPEASEKHLEGLDLMVLEALRYDPHPAHVSLSEALEVVARFRPRRAVLTHMAHTFEYNEVSAGLPEGVELAYDGMVLEV